MASSYLPSGVKISCTLTTVASFQQLGISRQKTTVVSEKGWTWLNVEDKKLSATFVCKSPQKFFDGLSSLLTGIVVGILVVMVAIVVVAAIVGTGGIAGAVLGALVLGTESAITTGLVVGLTGAAVVARLVVPVKNLIGKFEGKHPCDCTLSADSKWLKFHAKSSFDGQKAILQSSMLKCVQGGLLQPFLSPALAQKAAEKFAKNNNEELRLNENQQFFMGFVNGFAGLADPLGTSFCIGTGVYDYWTGNDWDTLANEGANDDEDLHHEVRNATRDQIGTVALGTGKGSKEVVEVITKQNKDIIREVMDQGGTYSQADRMTAWGEKTLLGEFKNMGVGLGVGIGFGLAGAVANHYIAKSYKEDKVGLIRDIKATRRALANQDLSSSAGVVANQKS